jgi:hypothetical protein
MLRDQIICINHDKKQVLKNILISFQITQYQVIHRNCNAYTLYKLITIKSKLTSVDP